MDDQLLSLDSRVITVAMLPRRCPRLQWLHSIIFVPTCGTAYMALLLAGRTRVPPIEKTQERSTKTMSDQKPQFGLTLSNRGIVTGDTTVEELLALARRADDSGWDSVWV